MKGILARISIADGEELSQLFYALRNRYSVLFPDEEVVFFSLPKNDPKERRRLMQLVFEWMEEESGTDL